MSVVSSWWFYSLVLCDFNSDSLSQKYPVIQINSMILRLSHLISTQILWVNSRVSWPKLTIFPIESFDFDSDFMIRLASRADLSGLIQPLLPTLPGNMSGRRRRCCCCCCCNCCGRWWPLVEGRTGALCLVYGGLAFSLFWSKHN